MLLLKGTLFPLLATCLLSAPGRILAQQVEAMRHARPVVLSGGIDATTIFYGANGIPDRYLPFNYVLSGSASVAVYGWNVPFSFVFSKQQSIFTQSFNQFGASPSYKWITLDVGYRSLNFSPFTLAGHTFLGGAIELNPGRFRFAVLYGQFNKATALDTAQSLYFSNFSYRRMGMAAKIGYGTADNYLDLIALRAKDVSSSLKIGKGFADSLGIAPAENTVVGYKLALSFWKKRLTIESDGALSLYTNDINAAPVQDSAYDPAVKKLTTLTPVLTSSELYSAFEASIRYKTRHFSLRLQYQHIDPGYQSMGAYFLNNDLQSYTMAPSLTAFKGKLRLSGSIGWQRDDLTNNKLSRSNRIIGSGNLSIEFNPHFGIDGNFSNYSINQMIKTIRFADSLQVVQSSSQFSINPHYTISGNGITHTLLLAANISQDKELNPAQTDSTNGIVNTDNYLFSYQLGITDAHSSFSLSLNYTQMQSQQLTDGNTGATLGYSQSWMKGMLSASASAGYLISKRDGENGRIITGSLQARYTFFKKHVLHLTAYYTGNHPDQATSYYPSYTEWRVESGYGFRF